MKPSAATPKTPAKSARSRYHVPNLERALKIFELLRTHPQGLNGAEIAASLGISKNAVFRITMTLLDHGYLTRSEDVKRFALSRKLLVLGYAAIGDQNLMTKALDVMRELRDATTESVIIGTLMGDEGVSLEQVPGLHTFRFTVEPGTRLMLHVSAPGKVLLAFLPERERDAILSRLSLTRFNERTIVTKEQFKKELEHVRELGYGTDRAEQFSGVHCVGAPVLDQHGYPIAALWTTGPAERLPEERFEEIGRLVIKHARRISRRFGNGLVKDHGEATHAGD
jgi:DNA-binding IclR family transcriptional regulator